MKFESLKDWLAKTLNEGGNAIPNSRAVSYSEAESTFAFVKSEIIPLFNITQNDVDTIGSYGKKRDDETYGDLDIVLDKEQIKINNNLEDNAILDFINNVLLDLGYDTKKMAGFNQVSAGIPIPNTSDIIQVDFMLSPNLEWSKFVYHSPDFKQNESNYKGVYRNALLMAIISETSKNILKQTDTGDVEELEANVIRFPEGVWNIRKNFMGTKGLIKTGKLLREYDKFITLDPNVVTELAVGPDYSPNDINTFEKLWKITRSPEFIHKQKSKEIISKFLINLKSFGLDISDEISRSIPINEFERGVDPKKGLHIGKYAPKHFNTIEELNDHIIEHLSDIFSGNVPKDLIDNRGTGMLMHLDYFNKFIAYYDNTKYSFYGQEHFEDLSYMPGEDKNGKDWREFLLDLVQQKLIPLGYE